MQNLSIYLHIPFCSVKCSYCAFNIYTNLEHRIPAFIEAMKKEIQWLGQHPDASRYRVHTIYIGGGTPTLLSAKQIDDILTTIKQSFSVQQDAEISIEANPDNLLDIEYLKALKAIGIHRLSIGVQSLQQSELALFGRLHNTQTVITAYDNARRAGFDNINFDLIYGIPRQTMVFWQDSLKGVAKLYPEHISLYALGVEPKTAMNYWIDNGKIPEPDDDLSADMYEFATEFLNQAGYIQYEISNWAKPHYESLHNKQYWYNLPYLGLGPGAHGFAGGYRYHVLRSPQRYIQAFEDVPTLENDFPLSAAIAEAVQVSKEDEISETIMMGLRLLQEGIHLEHFSKRFNVSLLDLRKTEIEQFVAQGLLKIEGPRLLLTERGRFVSNRILRDLI